MGISKAAHQVLMKPILTEKSAYVGGGLVFAVHPKATKDEIKNAIETSFEVKVTAVRTANFLGKEKRTRGAAGRRKAWKKAYVSLAEGSSLNLVEGL